MNYKKRLTTAGEADDFIRNLVAADKDFHFDDCPYDVHYYKTGEDLFTRDEKPHVVERVNELFDLLSDPHELVIKYVNERDGDESPFVVKGGAS